MDQFESFADPEPEIDGTLDQNFDCRSRRHTTPFAESNPFLEYVAKGMPRLGVWWLVGCEALPGKRKPGRNKESPEGEEQGGKAKIGEKTKFWQESDAPASEQTGE